jgi:ribosomal protein L11 methyltransferase
VPYRLDLTHARTDAVDRLIELGAIDVELSSDGGLAALLPDRMTPRTVAEALGISVSDLTVSPARERDDGSVWVLSPRPIRIGSLWIVPAHGHADPDAIQLVDSAAFGTGLHPTTALCLELLQEHVRHASRGAVLDVGTGSGILALAALKLGVPRVLGIDVDDRAVHTATENARINGLSARFEAARCGPDALSGTWPLVLANVLAAPLMEMAPMLVRRIGHHGQLVLSGIPCSLEHDTVASYLRLGMRRMSSTSRDGWVAVVLQSSW